MIEVSDAVRRFGSVPALNGVSLTVDAGEIVALFGRSGSGKSTLLNMLAGDPLDSGTVTVTTEPRWFMHGVRLPATSKLRGKPAGTAPLPSVAWSEPHD